MHHISFVETLDIARDGRLSQLRPAPIVLSEDDQRRGEGQRAPEAIGENLRAAVNAGSVVSFVGGLTETETTDVLFSTQLAQRAASAKHNRFADTEAWYGVYTDVLTRLGWVGEAFAFTRRATTAGAFTMDKSALDIIMTIATNNQLAILIKTLDTIKKLAEEDGALRVFEMQALAELSGNFQIGAVQRAGNSALALAVGAFHFRANNRKRHVLFARWGAEEVEFWTAAQKATLNRVLYSQHRAAVAARLAEDAKDYIAALEIV